MKKVLFSSFVLCAGITLTIGHVNASEHTEADPTASSHSLQLNAHRIQTADSGLDRFRYFMQHNSRTSDVTDKYDN